MIEVLMIQHILNKLIQTWKASIMVERNAFAEGVQIGWLLSLTSLVTSVMLLQIYCSVSLFFFHKMSSSVRIRLAWLLVRQL